MSYQSGINSLLATVAIAGKLDPNTEKRHELYQTEKQLSALNKAGASISVAAGGEAEASSDYAELASKTAELKKKKFELSPSEQTYKDYSRSASEARASQAAAKFFAKPNYVDIAEAEAERALMQEEERLRKTRGNTNYGN